MSGTANLVIAASAGSGKTYQLSNRYLQLLLDGAPPERILASTFTRKAAGEILERVVERLVEAASSDEGCTGLARALGGDQLDRGHVTATLAAFLRQLHRHQVLTLDSYFARLAASFGLELGLPPGWAMMDDDERAELQLEAIASVLDAEPGELADLLALLDKGQSRRRTREQLLEQLAPLLALWVDSLDGAWEIAEPAPGMSAAALRQACDQLRSLRASLDGKRLPKALDAVVDQAQGEEWAKLATGGLGKVVLGTGLYYNKELPTPLHEAVVPIAQHALDELRRQHARQTRATAELLARYHERLLAAKLARRRFWFDDIAGALHRQELLAKLDPGRIAWRMESPLSHMLLDEFQDTSVQQWSVLRPLAGELSGGEDSSFFAVGDAKQAIYGWRGGESRLLSQLRGELGEERVGLMQLDQSWRSSPVIMGFVNECFEGLGRIDPIASGDEPALQLAYGDFAFREHSTARPERRGQVVVEEVEEEGDPLELGALRAKGYLERGAPGGIALLVRTGSAEAKLRFRLQQLGVESTGAGGNLLTHYPAATSVLSVLRWIDHPGDRAAAFHVQQGPVGPALGLVGGDAAARLRELRVALHEEGFGPTLARWARALAPHCTQDELATLESLARIGGRFDTRGGGRPLDFVRHASLTRVGDVRPAPVQVMTIHQSKGLEFPCVILPELGRNMLPRTPAAVAARRELDGAVELARRYPPPALLEHDEELAQLVLDYRRRGLHEALCLLYVALTRAEHALHLILPKATKNPTHSTWGALLRQALELGQEPPGPGPRVLLERESAEGADAWIEQLRAEEHQATEPPPRLQVHGEARPATASPSALEGGQRRPLRDGLLMGNEGGLLYGLAVHAGLEAMAFVEDGLPALDEVEACIERALRREGERRHGLPASFVADRARELLAAVQQPVLAAALSRARYAARWGDDVELVLWRERNFLARVDGALLRGQYDRVVLGRRGGKWVGAEVLDYKSDRAPVDTELDDFLAGRRAHYRPQLRAYARALHARTGLPPGRISASLLLLAHDAEIAFAPEELEDDAP